MFKKILAQIDSVSIAAIIISVFSLVTKFLGILRDHLLARFFGAGADLDVYYAAFRLPDFIMNLLILGVVSAGLIPIMSKYLCQESGRDKFWKLLNQMVTLYLLVFGVISVIFLIFTEPVMKVLTPGFTDAQMDQVVYLTRFLFLSPLLLGLSSIFGSAVQVYKQFIIYSLAPLFYNIGIIAGIFFLAPVYGIKGVVFGVIIGAFLHLVLNWFAMRSMGYKYHFLVKQGNGDMTLLLKMSLPRFLTLALSQINLIYITTIATTLAVGSLSVFNFANNLQALPLSLIGIPFAIAAFPLLSNYYQSAEWEKYFDLFYVTVKKVIFFVLPATVIFILLRAQIVRLVLGSGKFDWNATILTMETLGIFALSLLAQSLIPLLVRAFYALENTITPFLIALISTFLNVTLSYTLINLPVPSILHEYLHSQTLGVLGLALAFTISNTIQLVLLWKWLRHKIGDNRSKTYDLWRFVIKNLIATGAMAASIQTYKIIWGTWFDLTAVWQVIGQIMVSLLLGGIVYYLLIKLLNVPEFNEWENKAIKRVKHIFYGKKQNS